MAESESLGSAATGSQFSDWPKTATELFAVFAAVAYGSGFLVM